MHASVILTVAQSKRLIAKAVAHMPEVQWALAKGTVVIGRGTTNGYVAEEILGHVIPKGEYVAGRTLPPGVPWERLGRGTYPDIVLVKGVPQEGATVVGAVAGMGPGDVFIKGGNALDYAHKTVGVLIGHPQGGTVGGMYGSVVSRKITLILPIGLEKLVVEDLDALARASRDPDTHPDAPVTSLFPLTGTVVTEIEAFRLLCGVEARLLAAGGVGGAEGAVCLLLEGKQAQLDMAIKAWKGLEGEAGLGLAS
jgi:hypothetical protein